jgi:hypothetical protein
MLITKSFFSPALQKGSSGFCQKDRRWPGRSWIKRSSSFLWWYRFRPVRDQEALAIDGRRCRTEQSGRRRRRRRRRSCETLWF